MASKFGENYTRRPIMPWGKSPCPCGSGMIFRDCCRRQLDDLPHRPNPGAHADTDPELALTLARAEFTRYTIWHATNTEPWFERDPEGAKELMEIDAEALGDFLARIRVFSRRHPAHPDFLVVLDLNAELLPTARWEEILLRERLIDAMARGEDDSKANELAKTFDLAGIEDAELLALALPYRDELSVSERLKFVDRIIEHSDDWEERVRFLCYRASLWGLLGDRKGAARGFMQAIKAVPADPEPDWGHSLVVGAYVQAGRSNARRDLVERALELCTRFLEGAADEPLLEFELRKARSAVMKGLSRDLDCIVDLRWVAEERGTDDDRIQLAQGLIAVGEFEEARTILQRVPFEDLTPGEQYDHTFALFGLLYGIQDEQLIALVRQRLADLDPEFPAWREIRDRFLLSLSRSGEKVEYPAWWASVRETVVLQPSVFGIGVDVGKLLDRALRRRGKGVDVHRQLHAKGDEGS